MNSSPIYRWKSFWLGVFGVCSLAWGWRDSMNFSSVIAWREFRAINIGGAIVLTRFGVVSAPGPGTFMGLEWRRGDLRPATASFSSFVSPLFGRGGGMKHRDDDPLAEPEAYRDKLEFFMRYRPRGDSLLYIPHWLMLLAFAGPWSAFLAWRWRRMRRLA